MNRHMLGLAALTSALLSGAVARADNPIILDQFTADPTARVFEGKIYLYPSHDMPSARQARGGQGWFAMEDYHTFSSENLLDWKDHGVIVKQTDVPWVRGAANSMWAPDCVFKDGKYYFVFPASNRIGVATSDKPYGPFTISPQPIANGIDPCCFFDPKDGKAYMVWAGGGLTIAKLKDDLSGLDGPTMRVQNLPSPGLVEGPFMFERKGKYYMTYPHSWNGGAERLEYNMADSPMGPYKYVGVIMDQNPPPIVITQEMKDKDIKPIQCWTNHHSIVEYKDQWYLFYHDRDLSPEFDKDRSVKIDYLTFNDDGTIQKVIPTLRGVGICDAKRQIQIDRYSAVSPEGTTLSFVDESKRVLGWKIDLAQKGAWVEYDRVDFGAGGLKSVVARSTSSTGGPIEIHVDKADGPLLARVTLPKNADWSETEAAVANVPSGVHNLVVTLPEQADVAVDWVSFK